MPSWLCTSNGFTQPHKPRLDDDSDKEDGNPSVGSKDGNQLRECVRLKLTSDCEPVGQSSV